MSLISHEGYPIIFGGGSFRDPSEVELPEVAVLRSLQQTLTGYEQTIQLGDPPDGWSWQVGGRLGPFVHPSAGIVTVPVDFDSANSGTIFAMLVDGEANVSQAVALQLRGQYVGTGEILPPPPPPPPPPDPFPNIGTPSLTSLTQAFTTNDNHIEYSFDFGLGSDNDSNGISSPARAHTPFTVAVAALKNVTTPIGGKAPLTRLNEILVYWAANRLPGGRGGFPAKFEIGFVATVAIARLIPSVWEGLSDQQRLRLTLAMKACLIGSAYDCATGNTYGAVSAKSRSVRGYTAWRSNPNFSTPPALIPHMVAGFLGITEAHTFMQGFDRAVFAKEIADAFPVQVAAGTRIDMWDTYRRDWTAAIQYGTPPGPGPTKLQLENAIHNWTYHGDGSSILIPMATLQGQIERYFSKTIRPGLNPEPGQDPAQPWGVRNTAQGYWAGRIINPARWAGVQNQGLVGAAFELDSTDAGGASPSNKRSSMGYVHDGLAALLMAIVVAKAQGFIDWNSPNFTRAKTRMARGMDDLLYKLGATRAGTVISIVPGDTGYQDYAKGGTGTNNNIWSWNNRNASENLSCMHGLYYESIL